MDTIYLLIVIMNMRGKIVSVETLDHYDSKVECWNVRDALIQDITSKDFLMLYVCSPQVDI